MCACDVRARVRHCACVRVCAGLWGCAVAQQVVKSLKAKVCLLSVCCCLRPPTVCTSSACGAPPGASLAVPPPPPSLRRLRADEEHKRTSTNTCGLASAIDDDQLRANFPDKEISKRGACGRERASMVRGEELSPTGHGGHGWVWLRCEC